MSLEGNWEGFYSYDDVREGEGLNWDSEEYKKVQIEVSFQQSLHITQGQMPDVKPKSQTAQFRKHVFQNRKAFGLKNFLGWQKLLFFRPDLELEGADPLEASCGGHLQGAEIFFVKTYAGQSTYRYLENGVELGETTEPMAPVTYRGILSENDSVIRGSWLIARQHVLDVPDIPEIQGSFELRRRPPVC